MKNSKKKTSQSGKIEDYWELWKQFRGVVKRHTLKVNESHYIFLQQNFRVFCGGYIRLPAPLGIELTATDLLLLCYFIR